jgi:hypothetical protein
VKPRDPLLSMSAIARNAAQELLTLVVSRGCSSDLIAAARNARDKALELELAVERLAGPDRVREEMRRRG